MLLAFDLDRTIVTEDYRLPEAIAAAIRAARTRGHHIAVLTGRARVSAMPFLEALELTGPYSVNNGALVIGPDGSVLRRRLLAHDEVRALIQPYADHPELEFSALLDDALYVRDPGDPRWAWVHTLNRRIERYQPELDLEADKVVFGANGLGPTLAAELRRDFPTLLVYRWDDGYVEITAPDSDKGAALALIAETMGVPRSETVAFGDGPNDITMVGWAGHGVAVGPHAHPEVLAAAAEHIPSPEEEGVATWLTANLG